MKRHFLLVLLVLSACSAVRGRETAEHAVSQFRSNYDQGQFAEIYAATHPTFKNVSTQKEFVDMMQVLHHKLGKVKSTARTGSNVNVGSAGTGVHLVYTTEFQMGTGVEQFVWQVKGDGAQLLGYNINSPELIAK